jgi:Flp pilus assembly protein TadG
MTNRRRSKWGQRGSVMVMVTLAIPFLIGMVGLAIDATVCYIVKAELSAAVDGAALGAGRLLSTNANPIDVATQFLNANFRVGQAGFWGSSNLTPTIVVTTNVSKTVTVTASTTLPLIFMRVLGRPLATIAATATATRRDARIEFVIDRSGSMGSSDGAGSFVINDLVTYAQGFTQQFTNGYDEMGLVAYSGSAVVGYPTTPWPAGTSPTGAGGPDTNFNDGTPHDMVHQIGLITAGGGTGMGDGLATAYIELQKAHMRDMALNGKDTRTNVIVLFTDGVPSAVSTYMNRRLTGPTSVISSGSNCTNKIDSATPSSNAMYGYIVMGSSTAGAPPYSTAAGFNQLASLDTAALHTPWWYMANPLFDASLPIPTAPELNCTPSGWNDGLTNLSAIPATDKYGYSLGPDGNGYKVSSFTNSPSGATSIYTAGGGGFVAAGNQANQYQWGLAAWDEADQAAEAIRTDSNYANRTGDTSPMTITIYTIGYSGNGGTDRGLLKKIANINGCNVNGYSCSMIGQQPGLYAEAADPTALSNAINTIATAILRLAR